MFQATKIDKTPVSLLGGFVVKDDKGLAPDLDVNAKGAFQSKLDLDYSLLPPFALRRLAQTRHAATYEGRKYPAQQYRNISAEDHRRHAEYHFHKWREGDISEDHLGNLFCRLAFYIDLIERETDIHVTGQNKNRHEEEARTENSAEDCETEHAWWYDRKHHACINRKEYEDFQAWKNAKASGQKRETASGKEHQEARSGKKGRSGNVNAS